MVVPTYTCICGETYHDAECFAWHWQDCRKKPGLAPKGEPMPKTVEEWRYLAGLYALQIDEDKRTISSLKGRINVLEQRCAQRKMPASQPPRSL
jgi:hypothetical protein